MIATIKARALVCFCLIHVGLFLSIAALIRDGAQTMDFKTHGFYLAGAAVMYSGFLFAVLSVWMPLRPWMARYHRAREWRSWILQELPTILALLPVLFGAVKLLQAAWGEIKGYKEKDQLDVKRLAKVAQRFAEQAEELSHDPAVERVKKKVREAA